VCISTAAAWLSTRTKFEPNATTAFGNAPKSAAFLGCWKEVLFDASFFTAAYHSKWIASMLSTTTTSWKLFWAYESPRKEHKAEVKSVAPSKPAHLPYAAFTTSSRTSHVPFPGVWTIDADLLPCQIPWMCQYCALNLSPHQLSWMLSWPLRARIAPFAKPATTRLYLRLVLDLQLLPEVPIFVFAGCCRPSPTRLDIKVESTTPHHILTQMVSYFCN